MSGLRYVIYGAGAIGGGIGGRLFQHGHDVTLVARGAHGKAIAADGLHLVDAEAEVTLKVPVVAHPGEAELAEGDVVILAMKTQDTEDALRTLAAVAPAGIAVACAQNGVENERLALRHVEDVYGMLVMMPATHLEAGEVHLNSTPTTGILDIGRYPAGVDERAERIAADLSASTFSSRPDPAVMGAKYGKLVLNLGNAVDAITGERGGGPEGLTTRARAEARSVFAAAGIDAATEADDKARRGDLVKLRMAAGDDQTSHSSSWQSLARGSGSVEADFLNGEIVLLGRLHGVPTPVNATLQREVGRLARAGLPPGSLSLDELAALVEG